MAKYHITRKAVEDLSAIWEYTSETWSESQADNYYRKFVEVFKSICRSTVANIDREYKEIKSGLFGRKCGKHIIFYKQIPNGDFEIIRILHSRMDIVHKFK